MKHVISGLTIGLILLIFTACEENGILSTGQQISSVSIEANGLYSLGDSAWYELWAEVEGAEGVYYKSIGTFNPEEDDGAPIEKTFTIEPGYIQQATAFLLTIEADPYPGFRLVTIDTGAVVVTDTVEADPGRFVIMSAPIYGNLAALKPYSRFDFAEATGSYMLDTPTDPQKTNPKSGVWFVNRDSLQNLIAGLKLPDLTDNWYYEGWVLINGDTLSTGRFSSPVGADMENAFGGAQSGYDFPGQDFISNDTLGIGFPLDLSGTELMIALHPPYPAYSKEPFTAIPLQTTIPADADTMQIYYLENNLSAFPVFNVRYDLKIYE